jgi:hypothetical protein
MAGPVGWGLFRGAGGGGGVRSLTVAVR